jgi:mannose-1-phosphate guanylyltransferase
MFSVIMAGGSGTRFWPLSRAGKPKQFLEITGQSPLVVETCARLAPISRDSEIILVMGDGHLPRARELFPDRKVRLIGEPVGRNTAPAIGLGALQARRLGCSGPAAFLPADHFIRDPDTFVDALRLAEHAAASGGIATLGIEPVRPETGYGYIRRDREALPGGEGTVYRVRDFVEKPDPETALRYVSAGEYYWNAGIFVASPETILDEIRRHLPDLYAGLQRLEAAWEGPEFDRVIRDTYAALEPVSFDYGIMERTKRDLYVIPCACGWSDVGSWMSLYALRRDAWDENLNLIDGDALPVDCEKSYLSAGGGRLVACLGLQNCLVVDTPEIVLVADLDRAQDIRKVVAQLKAMGRKAVL